MPEHASYVHCMYDSAMHRTSGAGTEVWIERDVEKIVYTDMSNFKCAYVENSY